MPLKPVQKAKQMRGEGVGGFTGQGGGWAVKDDDESSIKLSVLNASWGRIILYRPKTRTTNQQYLPP